MSQDPELGNSDCRLEKLLEKVKLLAKRVLEDTFWIDLEEIEAIMVKLMRYEI